MFQYLPSIAVNEYILGHLSVAQKIIGILDSQSQ